MRSLFDSLSKFIFIFAIAGFFYGIWKFPDAPIRPCGENRYCGKYGKAHSVEDFRDYNRWEIFNMISIPSAIFLALFNDRMKKKFKPEQYFPQK